MNIKKFTAVLMLFLCILIPLSLPLNSYASNVDFDEKRFYEDWYRVNGTPTPKPTPYATPVPTPAPSPTPALQSSKENFSNTTIDVVTTPFYFAVFPFIFTLLNKRKTFSRNKLVGLSFLNVIIASALSAITRFAVFAVTPMFIWGTITYLFFKIKFKKTPQTQTTTQNAQKDIVNNNNEKVKVKPVVVKKPKNK